MSINLQKELEAYKDQVCWYVRFNSGMLKNSLIAFENKDMTIAIDILRQKEYIVSQYEILHERGILLIALYQPVASDLRTIACCLGMITSAERAGRYGKDIAELITGEGLLDNNTHVPDVVGKLIKTGNETVSMINLVCNCFTSGDTSLLLTLSESENLIDYSYLEIYKSCIKAMKTDTSVIESFCAYLLINRYIERCGDHACRMGELVFYMQTGKKVNIDDIEGICNNL